jgi:type III secretion protein J
VLAALQIAGISAEKIAGKEGMVGVSIDAEQVGLAVTLLREKGLPRERFAGMGQVFKKEGLISSPLEERARYLYALSQELGATLTQIDGVIVARVHVVLPERGISGEVGIPSSAAVFIKHQDGYNLDTVLPQVRRLVTNSIPGLTADKVSIVLVGAQSGRPADPVALPAGALGATAEKPMTQTGFSSPAVRGILLVIVALLLAAVAGLLAMKMGLLQRWGQKISASDSHATADKPPAAVAAASQSSSAG